MDRSDAREPPPLRDLGLLKIAEISSGAIVKFIRKNRRERGRVCIGEILERNEGDSPDEDAVTRDNDLRTIKEYVDDLPLTTFDEYALAFMKSDNTWRAMTMGLSSCHKCIKIVLNHIVSDKLSTFTSYYLDPHINSNRMATVLLEKISDCTGLDTLTISTCPRTDEKFIALGRVFQRLPKLTSISLMSGGAGSFHWAIKPVSLYCPSVTDLWVSYDGDEFDRDEGITLLKDCQNIETLWLNDVGQRRVPSDVSVLLKELKGLRTFYHKDILASIRQLHDESCDNPVTFGLQSLYSSEPRRSLIGLEDTVSLARTCPDIQLLTLNGTVASLEEMMRELPNLRTLVVGGPEVRNCLPHFFQDASFSSLTILKLEDFLDIDYDFVSACAHTCPSLQVLCFKHCLLNSTGELRMPIERNAAFPHLRDLTLTPSSCKSTNHLARVSSVWEVGTSLLSYLLSGTSKLNKLHLHLRNHPSQPEYERISQEFLDDVIYNDEHPELTSLQLVYPSDISVPFIERLIMTYNKLDTFGGVKTWPISDGEIVELRENHQSVSFLNECLCAYPEEWGIYIHHEESRGRYTYNVFFHYKIQYIYLS
uniref:Uncharacterized protein n=1 Tax=Melicertus latisulcatus pemonivirus TaxID=2984278 RepID=A0A9C7BQB6_9VIRU|nr:MAG: hypothetical protein [Melicertus latisulcatus pemonivirus]